MFFFCPKLGSLLSQVFFHWGEGMSLLLLNKYLLLENRDYNDIPICFMYVSGFSCLLSSEKDGKIVSVSKSNNPKVDRKGELKYPHQGAKSKNLSHCKILSNGES